MSYRSTRPARTASMSAAGSVTGAEHCGPMHGFIPPLDGEGGEGRRPEPGGVSVPASEMSPHPDAAKGVVGPPREGEV
jgi:hypothetical protein